MDTAKNVTNWAWLLGMPYPFPFMRGGRSSLMRRLSAKLRTSHTNWPAPRSTISTSRVDQISVTYITQRPCGTRASQAQRYDIGSVGSCKRRVNGSGKRVFYVWKGGRRAIKISSYVHNEHGLAKKMLVQRCPLTWRPAREC